MALAHALGRQRVLADAGSPARSSDRPNQWTRPRSCKPPRRGPSVGVYPLGWGYVRPRHDGGAMILGYATLPEPAIREGVRRLAAAVDEARTIPPSPPPSGEAIAELMTLPPG